VVQATTHLTWALECWSMDLSVLAMVMMLLF